MSDNEEIAEWKDFSDASQLEEQVTEVEKILKSFKIGMQPKTLDERNDLHSIECDFRFESYTFTLRYYYGNYIPVWNDGNRFYPASLIEMMDTSRDDQKMNNPVQKWFGVSEFIYACIENIYLSSLDISISNKLLSIISMAMSHMSIQIPIFVKCYDKTKLMIGSLPSEEGVLSPTIQFSLCHYENTNQDFKLSDVYVWIQNRLNIITQNVSLDDKLVMNITPQSRWSWNTKTDSSKPEWRKIILTKDSSLYALQNYKQGYCWGTIKDCVREYHLKVLWKSGTDYHINIPKPLDAYEYQIYPIFSGTNMENIELTLYPLCKNILRGLEKVLNKDNNNASYYKIGRYNKQLEIEKMEKNETNISDRTSSLIGSAITRISGAQVMATLQDIRELFTSILADNKYNKYKEPKYHAPSSIYYPRAPPSVSYKDIPGSSPVGSLLNLLIFRASELLTISPDYVFSIIWHDFLKLLKGFSDDKNYIPNLGTPLYKVQELIDQRPPLPNLNTSYLYQKLQMLNICIDEKKRKIDEEKYKENLKDQKVQQEEMKNDKIEEQKSDEWNDEWQDDDSDYITINKESDGFDTCEEDNEEGIETLTEEEKRYVNDGIKPNIPLYQQNMNAPEGHQGVYMKSDKYLLHTHIPLFVPLTLDPQIVTEDMLKEQQQLLEDMGDDVQGADIRRQLQSSSIISDMQAFKAANPRASVEDFVRWHSPNDWVVEEGQKEDEGHLSLRMSDYTSDFHKYWNESKPISVFDQQPFYNFEEEEKKVLLDLEKLSPLYVFLSFSLTHVTSVLYIFDTIPNFHSFDLLNTLFDELTSMVNKYSNTIYPILTSLLSPSPPSLTPSQQSAILTRYSSIVSFIQNLEYKASLMASYMGTFNNVSICNELLTCFSTFESTTKYAPVYKQEEKQCVLDVLKRYNIYDKPDCQYYLIHTFYPESTSVSASIGQLLPLGHRLRIRRNRTSTDVSEGIASSDLFI